MKSKNKKHVALYIRTSIEDGVEYIDVQKDKLKKFCLMQGYVCNDKYVYEDIGCSGTWEVNDRLELKKLLCDAEKGKLEMVIVYKIDRLARNLRILLNTIEDLNKLGVAFKSVMEPIDSSTPFGNSMINMLGVLQRWEGN